MKSIIIISIILLLGGCHEKQKEIQNIKMDTPIVKTIEETTQRSSEQDNEEMTTSITQESIVGIPVMVEREEEETMMDVVAEDEEEVYIPKGLREQEENAKQWYIRLIVEDVSNQLKTVSAQLGQVQSEESMGHYNLRALAPFGSRYVDVVFVNPEDSDTGSYKSSFHLVSTAEQSWEFTVKSHDINATMILGWRGLYILTPYTDTQGRQRYQEYRSLSNPLLDSMVLFDVSANKEVKVWEHDEIKEYVFHMEGNKEKVFQWRVKDTSILRTNVRKSLALRGISVPQNRQKIEISSLRKEAKARPRQEQLQRGESINMYAPPIFEVL